MARVPYIYELQSPDVDKIYQKAMARGANIYNLQRAIAHNPSILRNYMRLGQSILGQTEMSQQQTELAILYVAVVNDNEYIWAAHAPLALETGLNAKQIDALEQWRQSTLFDASSRAMFSYIEVILDRNNYEQDIEEVFTRLHEHYTDKMIVELTMLICYYNMTVLIADSLNIEIESSHILGLTQLLGKESIGHTTSE